MRMRNARFAAMSVMLAGPLFLYDPVQLFAASFPNDMYAHFATAAGQCSNTNGHMNDLQQIPTPQTFTLCKRQSQATQWSAEIRTYVTGALVCSYPWTAVPSSGEMTFTCTTNFATGNYKAYVIWKVGTSQPMTSLDQRFRK